ncbi:MAG TPA: hypothetical protein DD670_18900 [Planctomycetaceae bacterium]|nr:hypothetical protein [Planctomycetaceae bacterium]
MEPKRGYYSLIQFCPDASRLEAVNVGVILLCPDADYIGARTSAGNQRAAKLVGRDQIDKHALNSAKRAIERRLEIDRNSFKSRDDLEAFANTRGNDLKLTSPRPVKVFDPPRDLDRLFSQLVGGWSRTPTAERRVPELDDVFQKLHREDRAQLNLNVTVPVLGRSLRIPYAYTNGVLNLVRPQRFSDKEDNAMAAAERLALEGDLLQRHYQNGEGKKKLIVVSLFPKSEVGEAIANRVGHLLDEYKVASVPEKEIGQFVARVEREAHSA